MKLLDHLYGKAQVRVLKVTRGECRCLKELDVTVMLQGWFDASRTQADDSLLVPADTIKHIVNLVAREKLGAETEPFGVLLAQHFLDKFPQVDTAQVQMTEGCWDRIAVKGRPQVQSFIEKSPAKLFAEIISSRTATAIQSGISQLLMLKTTQCGFEGYDMNDEFTTLLETKDHVFATELRAGWWYSSRPASYADTNQKIIDAMLDSFASNQNPSVQATMKQMGEAALKSAPEISKITMAMPNKNCLRLDLTPFRAENENELSVPTNESHGQIEGTVSRE
jgi:urate oxidase